MAEKRGKGGYGSEKYDPNTGRYIADDKNQYHAGAGISVADIIEGIKAGEYDDPEQGYIVSDFFKDDNDEELEEDEEVWQKKSAVIAYIQEYLDDYWTEQAKLNTNFPEITFDEFRKWGQECYNATTVRDRSGFEWYRGNSTSFDFNKALRFGLDKFYSIYPRYSQSWELNPQSIIEKAQKLDNLTNSWEFPEDKKVFRFVDTAPLVSWFKSSGIFDGLKIIQNSFNYEELDSGYDIQDLANRLSMLVGTKVPPDGSFTSFSCLPNNSHMKKDWSRNIMIRYNVRAGTKAWISQYDYESEGLFNRNTGFFIQGVSVEKLGSREVIVLEYGIQ